jgi:uncharacterized membrane protein
MLASRSGGLPAWLVMVLLSLGVAGYALVAYLTLPLGAGVGPDMQANFEAHRIGIYTHIFAASVALILGPFQFSQQLRSRRPALHRLLGRLYLGVGVGIGGASGLYMAVFAYGGLMAKLGFGTMALAWLYTGMRAYLAARNRNFVAHRSWMVRNFALTFAAVTLRLYIPASFIAGLNFDVFYPIIAWACWVPNLLLAEVLWTKKR